MRTLQRQARLQQSPLHLGGRRGARVRGPARRQATAQEASAATGRAAGHRQQPVARRVAGAGGSYDGRWLEEAGFDLGREYEIDVEVGKLTLHAV